MMWRTYGSNPGQRQWPMRGYSVAIWMAILQGLLPDERGWALGWKTSGESCP